MDRFRKSLSFRNKKKAKTPEDDPNNKPMSWQEDEKKVREGCCSFQVKYLGFIEVFDSRGMQVCEETIKALRRPKKKTIRAILYVSGDTIRVSDEISKGLVVDQTIEKVSFCSPDRNHKRGFAYICRDGTTRRWMCHAFLAVKETGERLSHAVGCAFAICLEKKQKRESDAAQPPVHEKMFPKGGSFRQTSITERLQDPQSAIIVELPPPASPHPPAINAKSPNHSRAAIIPRPHASASFFTERQSSLRMFPKLQESSPFKRELSLRLSEAPGSSQLIQRRESSIDEEAIDSESNGNRDSLGRVSAFSTFSKSIYTSDNSAGGSPAHRMSTSFQSESPSIIHSNPFLLSGAINYGASSNFTSQDGINSNSDTKNDVGNSRTPLKFEQSTAESFQKLSITQANVPLSLMSPSNGCHSNSNLEYLPNMWNNRLTFHSIASSYETSSTNPWCEPPYPSQSELIYERSVLPLTQASSTEPSSTIMTIGSPDPFDISWINNDSDRKPPGTPFSNNPFLT